MEEGEKARCEETEEERSSEDAGGQPGDVQGDAVEEEEGRVDCGRFGIQS